ncbi:MAG: MT-A70 family methyltransferase [Pseudomonadota bacterium]
MADDLSTLPLFHYGLIMADPPWDFTTYSDKAQRSAKNHYDTMTVDQICAMQVGPLASRDCALLIWGTSPNLVEVLQVISAWGFEFKSKAFCWAKPNKLQSAGRADENSTWFMGMGYGTRANTEDCWLATTGSPERLNADVRELIIAPRREHSRKPDEAYERAERLFAGPYLDLFSREKRPGWDQFGNETSKFEVTHA